MNTPVYQGVEGLQVDGQKYRETKEWYFMYHVLQNLISQCKTKESANTCRILESTNTKRIVESTNTKQNIVSSNTKRIVESIH